MTSKPALYIFAISHFCEKGRWTLDHHKIAYDLKFIGPGFHSAIAKKLGAPATTYPILTAGDETIQGSAEIIDWADARGSGASLTPDSDREECLAIEQRLGESVGVHTRRMFYSEAMVEQPQMVKPVFTGDLDTFQRIVVSLGWGFVRKKMIESLDLGAEQGKDSQRIVEEELEWLEERLSDGRRFLVGNQFSRADLSAAALLSRWANPKEHPRYPFGDLPPRLSQLRASWKERPAFRWIREIYREYR